MLLEREPILQGLSVLLSESATAGGRVVAVCGEAGAGKSALVDQFLRRTASAARHLLGVCDSLYTPRPLGPLLDLVPQTDGPLSRASRSGADRERLFRAFLEELEAPGPQTIVVFEDVHWADEATLDLLKFAGRRIRQARGLLVITYRDDEIGPRHPLHQLLGELPRDAVRRQELPLLSEAAVRELARRAGRRSDGLHALTGGNPFFVTEILAGGADAVPSSVRDAVLARAQRLSPAARRVLDVSAIVPGRTERWVLDETIGETAGLVAECVGAGMLVPTTRAVAFRHELARRAWEETLEPGHAAELHAQVLGALAAHDGGASMLPRLVHHAERAGDAATVRRLAPAAAREAAAVGAHREAAAHYERALRYAGDLAAAERAALLDAWSYEVHLGGRMSDAVRAREEALGLWRRLGDRLREGDALRWLARLAWFEGRRDAAAACGDEAIRVLEPLGPSHELAMAYSGRAQWHILAEERHLAAEWGDRAVSMAEALDDPEALVHALTNAACLEPGGSREMQVRAVRLAQKHGLHEHALRAFTWLVCDAIVEQDHALAEGFLAEALEYAEARDIDAFALYLRGWRARMRVEQGRLREAEADAADVLRRENTSTVVRLPSLAALGTVRVRRGEPGAQELLDEALDLALSTGELQRIAPVANARAEAAWLRGDADAVRAEAMRAYPLALHANSPWDVGRLAAWLRRAGALDEPPPDVPGPVAEELAGRWREAAEGWQRRGCPYEQALALAAGDEGAQRTALEILDDLGARPAAALVRSRLVGGGARGLPRGPRRSTRANPARLTNRQLDVLALLVEGLPNPEIGRRLFLSPRTVDHHVSAILAKLGVRSRGEAAVAARARGLLS